MAETGIAEDGPCQEADGCPTETAVLRKFWRGQTIESRHYPEWYKALQPKRNVTHVQVGDPQQPPSTEELDAVVREFQNEGRAAGKFTRGDLVRKVSGSMWSGVVVGEYSTELTPEGYAVESLTERGSVQIYPAKALERMPATAILNPGWQGLADRDGIIDFGANPVNNSFIKGAFWAEEVLQKRNPVR